MCVFKNEKIVNNICSNCNYYLIDNCRKKQLKKSYSQNKKEKNRFSIIYSDLSKCCICDSTFNIELNEVFEGSYRQSSIKYGAVCPFCELHHKQFHNDRKFNLEYKCLFQNELIKLNDYNWYISIFKINYNFIKSKKD